MAFGTQESDSESSQGLMGQERYHFSSMMPGLHAQARARADEAYADPAGLQFGSTVDQMLPMGEYGLPIAATEGVKQLGRNLFAQTSGSRAFQGRVTPYNLEGVVGDAVRMSSPTLLPLSTQFALQRAAIAPALRQASFNFGIAPYEMAQRALSGSGSSTSSGSGLMVNLSDAIKAGAAAL